MFYVLFLPRYNDMGTIVIGKVESGCCKKGETLLIMPNKVTNMMITPDSRTLIKAYLRGR